MTSPLRDVAEWPEPGDPGRRETVLARWNEAAARLADGKDREFAEALPHDAVGSAMLSCVFGASPFLGSSMIAEQPFLRRLWNGGPESCVIGIIEGLRALPADTPEAEAGRALRVARRQAAVAVGLADIGNLWSVEAVTGALSELADASVSVALRVLLSRLAQRGAIAPADPTDPETGSGLIVLGLGKLGGGELNYSSDIDLILFFDPDVLPSKEPYEAQRHLIRLAKSLVSMLSDRTPDGYAFRVDLRLRPDPGSTPLVMSTEAAEVYYAGRGQTWERAALIKARPVAGDIDAANAFLGRIAPFVWRRHLDFATVQELHDLKKLIDSHHGHGEIRVRGHDLKLGRGGIREIEFFAQVHQLIWGGKDSRLRVIPTCQALAALAEVGRIPTEVAESFVDTYRFLRRAEHRVQMVDDEQTHALPEDEESFETYSRFLGYADGKAFSEALLAHLRRVERHYSEFFELSADLAGAGQSSFLQESGSRQSIEQMGRMGFKDPERVAAILEKWRGGGYRVTQGSRPRELLHALTPSLLIAMLGTDDPDLAIGRFDNLLARLPTGLQVFALFRANVQVMESVAQILVSAPLFSERLIARPALFEALLESGATEVAPTRAMLSAELELQLGSSGDYEDTINRLRRWVDAARFRAGIHMLFDRIDPLDAATVLSDISEQTLEALFAAVREEFARRFGRVAGGESAILAMGRLGGREMSITSDLDLLLIYDAPEGAESDGDRQLPAATYYNRLLRRLLSALKGQVSGGEIYDIDMRLRPSGNAGPLAVSLEAFGHYHRESAWTWERMAMTRARVVAGDAGLADRCARTIRDCLAMERDPVQLLGDVADMRRRMDDEFHTDNPWSIKHYRGGLVDIEFIAQYLQLRDNPGNGNAFEGNTGEALRALAATGSLADADAETLLHAWTFWSRLQALQRLIHEDADGEGIPGRTRPLVAKVAGVAEFDAVVGKIEEAAGVVRGVYARIIDSPETTDA